MVSQEILDEAERLINANPDLLIERAKQKRFVYSVLSMAAPCPNCQEPIVPLFAANEGWTYEKHSDTDYHCPNCGVKLTYCVPLFAAGVPFFWKLTERLV